MFKFLHTFQPEAVLLQIGPLTVYYYGLFIVLGIILGSLVSVRLARRWGFAAEAVIDSAFWALLAAIAGARLYHTAIHAGYYLGLPWEILFVWQGGLAIHGGLIAGTLALYLYCRRRRLEFWGLAALYAPGLALAQAIGRWGNYFNQELYGYPTDLPWGIPIEPVRRLPEFIQSEYFHPAFLYESIGNLLILAILLFIFWLSGRRPGQDLPARLILSAYLILYSLLRFATEFFRTDPTPALWGLRLPQIVSLIVIISVIGWWIIAAASKPGSKIKA